MNGYMNGMGMMNGFNPNLSQDYLSRMSVNNFPHYDIIKVKGQNGAEAFQMAPNSKVLLLDEKNLQYRRRGDGNYANYNFEDDDENEEEFGYYPYEYRRSYPKYYRY